MTTCDFVLRQTAEVPSLDRLSPLAQWRLLRHISHCAECAQTYRQMEKMEHAARALYANAAPSPQFAERVEERLALLPATTSTRRAIQKRHEKKDKKMQRGISFAVAVCAAFGVLFFGLREKPAPAARAVLLQMQTALAQNQTAHVAVYSVEIFETTNHTMIRFGKLTKLQEWWNAPEGKQRVEASYFPDLVGYAADKSHAIRRRGIIYANGTKWEFAPDTQNKVEQSTGGPQTPMGWKNYSLETLAGDDNTGLRESIITDGGTRRENNRTIRTIIVQRKDINYRSRWVCQIDAHTNLPIQFDDTNQRGGKWVTTMRYVFDFNRPAPVSLFDPQTLPAAPPAALAFPAVPADTVEVSQQSSPQAQTFPFAPTEAEKIVPQSPNLSAQIQTVHQCTYLLEEGDDKTGKVVGFGKLTKAEEWWKSGSTMRQETPYFRDLVALAGKGIVSDKRHWRTIYTPENEWQYSPEDQQVRAYPANPAETQTPMGLKGYTLNNLTTSHKTVSDGGTRTENGRTIHTLIVKRSGDRNGSPVWVCQMDAKANLPIRVDNTSKRSGKWITTGRYEFEWNRPLPASLFDPKQLQNPPPADFTFPATQ